MQGGLHFTQIFRIVSQAGTQNMFSLKRVKTKFLVESLESQPYTNQTQKQLK